MKTKQHTFGPVTVDERLNEATIRFPEQVLNALEAEVFALSLLDAIEKARKIIRDQLPEL